MSHSSANLMVALINRTVCIKIRGRANFTASVDFKKLVAELYNRDYTRFIFDLSECLNMDSTFLGVLSGIGLKFGSPNGTSNSEKVELLNPSPRITELFEGLGVDQLFNIVHRELPVDGKFEEIPVGDGTSDRVEVARTCLEAHRTLMDINPENVAKFKDCTRFLAEDLKKLEGDVEKAKG